MNKDFIFVVFICITLLFTSCCTLVSNADADSGLTLAGIKKAALDKGYTVETLQGFQANSEPRPVDGFNLRYKDECSEAYIPVLEFKSADDAQLYAKQVNEKGYNLCIVNGKYLTMTGAQYGVVINDNQKNLLETLLKSKVMEYTEATPALISPAKDFAGGYKQVETIRKALDKLVNKSVLLHDKAVPENERISSAFVTFSLLLSGDLGFISNLCEDQVQLNAILKLWEMFGCTDVKLKHDAAHEYTMTGKRAGCDTTFEIHCSFDPKTGSLRLIDTDGGVVFELYEFVPMGGDKYAFQTLYERGIVEYKDGKILSFVYSLNKRDKALAYNSAKNGIYGKGPGVDRLWVSKAGEGSYEQFITFDGTELKISADSIMGKRLQAEINAQ